MAKKKRNRKPHEIPPHLRETPDYVKLNLASSLSRKNREKFINQVDECSTAEFPQSVLLDVGRQAILAKAYRIAGAYDSASKRKKGSKGSKGSRTERAYHGTPHKNVASIVATHFKLPGHYGMFGRAVYLSPDIRKCFGYTGTRGRTTGYSVFILVCAVSMGKVFHASEAINDLDPEKAQEKGYDTVIGFAGKTKSYTESLRYSEYAVYDPARIRVTHILQYQVGVVPQRLA